jgi:hypothetical protein
MTTSIADKRIYTVRGFLHDNEPEYKRMYICLTDDEFTNSFLMSKRNLGNLDTNPIWKDRTYKNYPPGFFVKYNGKTTFALDANTEKLCILNDLKGQHVVLQVQYKSYKYDNKNGWNLTCINIWPAS